MARPRKDSKEKPMAATMPPPSIDLPQRRIRPPALDPEDDGQPEEPPEMEPGEVDDEEIEDEEEVGEASDAFAGGVGVGAGRPELDRIGGRPEGGVERELDMGPVDLETGSSRRLERPLGVDNDDLEPLARQLARAGSRIRIQVTRLYPDDMPPNEKGPHDWMEVPGTEPGPDQVKQMIRQRFGGGRYEVIVADVDPAEIGKRIRISQLDIGGDPQPFTLEGRAWFQRKYGTAPVVMGTGPDGKPSAAPIDMANGPLGLLHTVMQGIDARERNLREIQSRERDRETTLAAAILQGGMNKGGGGDTLRALLAFAPVALEFMRGMRDDSRRDREERDKRLEMMLDRASKQQGPGDVLSMVQPIFALQQKRAEMEIDTYARNSQKIFDQALNALRVSGREEDATVLGSLASAIREHGGDIIKGVAPVLMGMVTGQSAAQTARALNVDPRIINRGAPARPPLPPAARPAGQQRAPVGPGPVAPPPPPAGAPEPARGTENLPATPEVAREGATPEVAQEVPAPAPAVALPPPGQFAAAMSMDFLRRFLYYVRGFAEQQPDPEFAWGAVFDGQTIEVLYGLSPLAFRQRVEATDIEKPFLVQSWVAGAPQDILDGAAEFDAFLESSGPSREWFSEFFLCGPMAGDEEEGDES